MVVRNRLALAKIINIQKKNDFENGVTIKHKTRLVLLDRFNIRKFVQTATDIESNNRLYIIDYKDALKAKYILDINEYDMIYHRNIYDVDLISDVKILKKLGVELPLFLSKKQLKVLAASVNKEKDDNLAKKLVLNKEFINRRKNNVK